MKPGLPAQWTAALGACLLVLALPAQDKGTQGKGALVGLEALEAEWKAANQNYRSASKKVQATDEYKAARKEGDFDTIRKLMADVKRPDAKVFGARALELADSYAGDESLKVLTYAANTFYDEDCWKGIYERVDKHHVGNPALASLLSKGSMFARYVGNDEAKALLTRVADENPADLAKAWALYTKGQILSRDKEAPDEERAMAKDLLAKAEVLAGDSLLGDRIRGPKFQQERLQIGMVAPEIVGTDTDGIEFKLSDYRGKVVVIDFWGFW